MSELRMLYYGKAVGKQRPRVTGHGTYTPQKTKEFERIFGILYRRLGGKMMTGAVGLRVWVLVAPAKSLSRKKQAELIGTPCLKKPDADNIVKAIQDGLNGIAYQDDACVMIEGAEKIYATRDMIIVDIHPHESNVEAIKCYL